MKRLMFVTGVLVLAGCAGSKKAVNDRPSVMSAWQSTPVEVDGSDADWEVIYPGMDANARLSYAISNDRVNLYITVKTSDRLTQMRLLHSGMRVWLDKDGKQNMKTSIQFPMEQSEPVKMERPDNGEFDPRVKPEESDRLRKMAEKPKEYSLQGFFGCNGVFLLNKENSCGIAAKLGANDRNELVWEAAVPFRSFFKPDVDSQDMGRIISVCLEIPGLKMPEPPSGMQPPGDDMQRGGFPPGGGMAGGMSGGMPGGGGGPGMGGPGMGGGRSFPGTPGNINATKSWIKIRLAYAGT